MPSAPKLEAPQGQPLHDVQFRAISESLAGNGVLTNSDLEVTDGTNALEIDVASGTVYYVATEYTYAGASPAATLSSGDATYDRWDTIAFDTGTSSVVVHEGTPAQYPEPPDISGGEVLLAIVFVASGATDIGSSDILNWRAKFSNESEEVHYDDSTGYWGADNVESVLDAAPSEFVQRDYATNSGALVLTDMPVDGNASAGTEQSFAWAIDSLELLKVYAESDGSGGIQNAMVRLENSGLQIGEPGVDNQFELTNYTVDNSGNTIEAAWGFYGGGGWYFRLTDVTNGTIISEMNLGISGAFNFKNDIADDQGNTVWDYANQYVPLGSLNNAGDVTWTGQHTWDTPLEGAHLTTPATPSAGYDRAYFKSDHFLYSLDENGRERRVGGDVKSATVSANYTTQYEDILFADPSGTGGITITLASADAQPGHGIMVIDTGAAAGANPITVNTEGTETIDGGSSKKIDQDSSQILLESDGSNWFSAGGAAAVGVDVEKFDKSESGTVLTGNVGVTWATHVPDGHTMEVYQSSLLLDSLEAAPSGLDLVIYTGDNAGAATHRQTILTGDGTVLDDQTGDPLATWTNSTGGGLTTAIGVDNGNFNSGTGADQDVVLGYKGRVVA